MPTEEMLEKLKDPKFYLENFCKIKTKQRGIHPFILREAQKDLFNTLRKHNRIMILKCRQLGFSTAITGYFYHDTIMRPGTTTGLIGYNSAMTAELLDKIKTFLKFTPPELRPKVHYNSKYEISFPATDSKILVLPSTENVGRSYTLNNCLCTELAVWEKAEEKMIVLEASVPVDGRMIVESTPSGQGNLYHRMWMDDDNDYVKKMYGWWWGYSRDEIDLIKRRINNPMKFAQEYGLRFLTSGRPVFDAEVIDTMREKVLRIGDTVILADETSYTVKAEDDLRIYRPPVSGGLYIVGVDVAEGVSGGDYSVAVIWDRKTGEEVGFYRGLIAPDRFGEKLDRWGRRYNNALMVVEINNHGLTTMTVLKQRIYPSMYFRPAKFENMGTPYSDKLGWKTNKVTRPLLIDDFAQATRDGVLTIHSKEILDEMSVFVYDDNGEMTPQSGFNDDTIFAAGVGFQGFKVLYDKPLTQLDYTKYLQVNYAY